MIWFFLIILILSLLIPIGLYKLRKRFYPKDENQGEYISEPIFSFLASLYAFYIGFSMVTLWSNFNTAKEKVTHEAICLGAVYRISYNFSEAALLRQSLLNYIKSVINDEFPLMDKSIQMSPKTNALFNKMWREYVKLRPIDKRDNNLYISLGSSLFDALKYRHFRSTTLRDNLYSPIWIIIIAGFIAVLSGLFYTNISLRFSKLILEFFVLFILLSCIYALHDISTPFSGLVNVSPRPFVVAYDLLSKLKM